MPGTVTGGLKTASTIKKTDPDFYAKIGSIGGSAPTDKPKGFAVNRDLARRVGAKGGRKSKRGPARLTEAQVERIYADANKTEKKVLSYEKPRRGRANVTTKNTVRVSKWRSPSRLGALVSRIQQSVRHFL